MARAAFRDHQGTVVRPGDRVRILAVPNLSGMRSPFREQTESVFLHIKGRVKRVREIDAHGNAVLTFRIQSGALAGYHSVAIEGAHVRKLPPGVA